LSLPKSVYKRLPKRMPKSVGFSKYCLDFDGAEDYVDTPYIDVAESPPFSMMAWFKPVGSSPDDAGVFAYRIADWFRTGIAYRDNTRAHIRVTDPSANNYLVFNPSYSYDIWHHVALTVGGGDIKVYHNGVLETTGTYSGWDSTGSFDSLQIGRTTRGGTWYYFYGPINDVRLYNRVLSKTEVNYMLNNYHLPVDLGGLLGWWKFEEGTGLTAYDKSGNGNDGTINGATWIEQKKWEMRAEAGL